MSDYQIGIVNSQSFGKYYPEHLEELKTLGEVTKVHISAVATDEEIGSQLASYDCLITSVTPEFTADFFAMTPKLKLIARHGLGVNNIDLEAATKHQVYVTKVTAEVETEAVAEHAIALMLALGRLIPQADYALRNTPWEKRVNFVGIELKELTVGIIGYGHIGQRVGDILRQGFGTQILVYDPYQSAKKIQKSGGQKVTLEELLSQSDVISLHANVTEANQGLLGAREFSQLKPTVRVINTARGALVDEGALVKALKAKQIAGYAADVFESEPLLQTSPLLAFENVVLTPHIGAYTAESLAGMGAKVVNDVRAVLNGEVPLEVVNKEVSQ
ncbi:D-isomer specific 2-hydroxyacid dehydrogenase family protein [Vagococcus salmoninarum]|uniref:D-isomer specific 2-hydroxyacid dehydrogenase family protein n=1 Tax=Vagococcus salmoninarum TaxID=2739 RepID=UPI001882EC4E|nr:D-isomer specific 2-hydroxyacid dehydrogenase family protein [Vagococcus salmoninarum]MBE9389371.1 hydroxyacid dehydrogenase [Vagococcus salmoninarum]